MKFKPQILMIYALNLFTLTFAPVGFYQHTNISTSVKH